MIIFEQITTVLLKLKELGYKVTSNKTETNTLLFFGFETRVWHRVSVQNNLDDYDWVLDHFLKSAKNELKLNQKNEK